MKTDITNAQQSLRLLEAGISPKTANMMLARTSDNTIWVPITSGLILLDDKKERSLANPIDDFPESDFEAQKLHATTTNMLPAWTTGALLDAIPDDRRQTVMTTRGGYDSSLMENADDDGYVSDAYFANYDFEDEENNVFYNKVYGGDSYSEAVTELVVDFLTQIRHLIPQMAGMADTERQKHIDV